MTRFVSQFFVLVVAHKVKFFSGLAVLALVVLIQHRQSLLSFRHDTTVVQPDSSGVSITKSRMPDQAFESPAAARRPRIVSVHVRNQRAAIEFVLSKDASELKDVRYMVRSACLPKPVVAKESPAVVTDLPIGQNCTFNVQLISGSGVSEPSPDSAATLILDQRYFGYYNYYHGAKDYPTNPSYFDTTPIADHTNVVIIHLNDPHFKERVVEAYTRKMSVVIEISTLFYKVTNNPLRPDDSESFLWIKTALSDYETKWSELARFLMPYRSSIAAFYDEEAYWGAGYLQHTSTEDSIVAAIEQTNVVLNTIATTIKKSFPEIPFMLMDEGFAFAGQFLMGTEPNRVLKTCVPCRNAIRIPKVVDWVGFEGEYPKDLAQFENWEGQGHSVTDYLAFTKAKLTSDHQKLALAPPAFALKDQGYRADRNLVRVIDRFFKIAREEPRLVAVFPYYWYAPNEKTARRGLLDQPRSTLRDAYKRFGKCFLSRFEARTCRDY